MSRYIHRVDEHTHTAYGYDRRLNGFFLQVYDNRLEWKETNTEEENRKAEEADPTGDGEIHSYATNEWLIPTDNDHVLTSEELATKMREYGINDDHCNHTAKGQPY